MTLLVVIINKKDNQFWEYLTCLKERLARIEQELEEEEQQRRLQGQHKVAQIEIAEQRRHAPVNDSQMVDEMFGFIDAQSDLVSEAAGPSAFKVYYDSCSLECFRFMASSKQETGVD